RSPVLSRWSGCVIARVPRAACPPVGGSHGQTSCPWHPEHDALHRPAALIWRGRPRPPTLSHRRSLMVPNTRREFLAAARRGMLVASLGAAVAADLGLAPASAADPTDTLDFGPLEPLVALLQET